MDLLTIEPSIIEGSIKGKNFFFYGGPGTWKTTVAAAFPHALFCATERGYKFIAGVYGQMIKTWRDAREFLNQLKKTEVQEKYDTIVFDRIDTLYKLCFDFVLKTNGATAPDDPVLNGSGWTKIGNEWSKFIDSLESLGYGLVFICHDKENDKEDEKITGAQKIDLQRTGLKPVRGVCDFIFNVEKEMNVETGEINCYASSNSISARTKKRARYFPDKFLFTYNELESQLDKAVALQCKIEGIQSKLYTRVEEKPRPYKELHAAVLAKVKELLNSESPAVKDVTTTLQVLLQGKSITSVADDERYYDIMLTLDGYLAGLN